MKVTIEEALTATDIPWTPFLLYSEILEGAREPLVFLDVVLEVFDLIGKDGRDFYFPKATQLTATETDSTSKDYELKIVDDEVMCSTAEKTITKETVTVDTMIWSAVELSDILSEDYVSIDWVRLNMRNMGSAVMEKLNENVDGLVNAGAGSTSTPAALNFNAISDALAAMGEDFTAGGSGWLVDPATPPFLIVSPSQAADLVQDTKWVETPRFYGQAPDRLLGEQGLYCGCRVLVSPYLSTVHSGNDCYIVMPPNYKWGPSVVIVWKRRLRVRTDRYECYETTYYVTTIRAKGKVVQDTGVHKITITPT